MDSNPKRAAFPYKLEDVTKYQWIDSGLTKTEYFALHLMCASVAANDHANPSWMTDEVAYDHARSAVSLARALNNVLKEIGE
jgi:hypothetical protein